MRREFHVRFVEELGGKFPGFTHPRIKTRIKKKRAEMKDWY